LALNVIKGIQNAENVLVRIDPLDLDSLPESVLARTQEAFGEGVTPLQSIHQILDDVLIDLQKTVEGNLMVDIEMLETNMKKEKIHSI